MSWLSVEQEVHYRRLGHNSLFSYLKLLTELVNDQLDYLLIEVGRQINNKIPEAAKLIIHAINTNDIAIIWTLTTRGRRLIRPIQNPILGPVNWGQQLVSRYREPIDGPIWRRINNQSTIIDITDYIEDVKYLSSHHQLKRYNHELKRHNLTQLYYHLVGQFDKYLVVAGEYPLHLITGSPCHQVDLYLIRDNEYQISRYLKIIKEYIDAIRDDDLTIVAIDDYLIIRRSGEIEGVPSTIRLHLRVYDSLRDVITSTKIGLYQGRLYATERVLYQIINHSITNSTDNQSIQGHMITDMSEFNDLILVEDKLSMLSIEAVKYETNNMIDSVEMITTSLIGLFNR